MKEAVFRFPPGFIEKMKKIYPRHFHQVLHTCLEKKIPTFRINYVKLDLPALRKRIIAEKVKCREIPFPQGTFILHMPLREFQTKDLYLNGEVFVQNVSSMLPVIVLEPQNGEKILDLCAAPGSKTTQIVSLAPQAQVTAVEKSRIRYYKLLANLKIQGADAVTVVLSDGIWVRKKFPETFDRILVDASCSAEGCFDVTNPHSYKYWKERKVREMVHTQKKLMHAAFFALKEGGTLVYSTCTFSPEENEEVVDWFLGKFKGKMEMVPFSIPLSNAWEGFSAWGDQRFDPAVRLSRRIIPNEYMEGFFIAKFKKIAV